MWSHGACFSTERAPFPGELHIFELHPAEPANEFPAVEQEASSARWCQGVREYLGERLALEIEIGTGVTHRRIETGVAQPLADGGEIDPGLK